MVRETDAERDARARSLHALSDALACSSPGIALDERGYTRSFTENLVSSVEVSDFEANLAQGSGEELAGKFRAAHSSSALAVNCFAPFKRHLSDLRVSGAEGFSSLQFEAKCPTGLRGTPPNLDVLLERGERVVAIESKCLEYLSAHVADFSCAYLTRIQDERRHTTWYRELLRLVEAPRAYRWLDTAQLVKHALGLMHTYPGRALTLLYLYWEPLNASNLSVFGEHQRETTAFAERVASSRLAFESMTYNDLWTSWDSGAPQWLRAHLRCLRDRYGVEI